MGKHFKKGHAAQHAGQNSFQKWKNKPKAGSHGDKAGNSNRDGRKDSQARNVSPATGTMTAAPSSSVYNRPQVLPTSCLIPATRNFVYSDHPQYQKLLDTSYKGFVTETAREYGEDLDRRFQSALEALDAQGFFQFDMTQPGGLNTKVARTFVSRTLVGDPGTTYKYLGLRMFAHPWTPDSVGSNDSFVQIGELNSHLVDRTQQLLSRLSRPQVGPCQYNLTLINRCYPESQLKLKKEPLFEQDVCSVSWHADSSLEHYSSIGVYHFFRSDSVMGNEKEAEEKEKAWRIALRVLPNAEGPHQGRVEKGYEASPPVAVTLPAQCVYYMLDDFNHHHQHAVLAGQTHRFASTHRVSLREGHSWDYISGRCHSVLAEKISAQRKSVRKLSLVLLEMEFEWLRQFYIQGERHLRLHTWWHAPMEDLQRSYQQLWGRLGILLRCMKAAAQGLAHRKDDSNLARSIHKKVHKHVHEVEEGSFIEAVSYLREVADKRKGWAAREKDPLYRSCAEEDRPISLAQLECMQESVQLAQEWKEEVGHAGKETEMETVAGWDVDALRQAAEKWQTEFTQKRSTGH